jgi:hypothetical protein
MNVRTPLAMVDDASSIASGVPTLVLISYPILLHNSDLFPIMTSDNSSFDSHPSGLSSSSACDPSYCYVPSGLPGYPTAFDQIVSIVTSLRVSGQMGFASFVSVRADVC